LDWGINTVAQLNSTPHKTTTPRRHCPRRSRQAAQLASAIVPDDVPRQPVALAAAIRYKPSSHHHSFTVPPSSSDHAHMIAETPYGLALAEIS
jgi:hypothetical protein